MTELISGLRSKTLYRVRMRAVNSDGNYSDVRGNSATYTR